MKMQQLSDCWLLTLILLFYIMSDPIISNVKFSNQKIYSYLAERLILMGMLLKRRMTKYSRLQFPPM